MPPGARIYAAVAYSGPFEPMLRPPFSGLPGYAVIRHRVYWSGTFAEPSQNIVVRAPVYAAAPSPPLNFRSDRPRAQDIDPYTAALASFYDYALIVNPELWPVRPPSAWTPVITTPQATLFATGRAGH